MVRTILMLLLIATVVASVGYQVGAYHARQTFEPQVVTEYVPLPPEIIEVEVVKEVPVEVQRAVITILSVLKSMARGVAESKGGQTNS